VTGLLAEMWAAAQAYNATGPQREWIGEKLDERDRGRAALDALRRAAEHFARDRDAPDPEGFAATVVAAVGRHPPFDPRPKRWRRLLDRMFRRDPRRYASATPFERYAPDYFVGLLADPAFADHQRLLRPGVEKSAVGLASQFRSELASEGTRWSAYFLDESAAARAREAERRRWALVPIAFTAAAAVGLGTSLAAAVTPGDQRGQAVAGAGVAVVSAAGAGAAIARDEGRRRRELLRLHAELIPLAAVLTGTDPRPGTPVLPLVLGAVQELRHWLDGERAPPPADWVYDVAGLTDARLDDLGGFAERLLDRHTAELDAAVGDDLLALHTAALRFARDREGEDYAQALIYLLAALGYVETELWGAAPDLRRAA